VQVSSGRPTDFQKMHTLFNPSNGLPQFGRVRQPVVLKTGSIKGDITIGASKVFLNPA
jgi:hypothetical protein